MKVLLLLPLFVLLLRPIHGNTILDVAAGQTDLGFLLQAVNGAQLSDYLSGPGPFTVFGPTNDAVIAVQGALTRLFNTTYFVHLQDLLLYHVIEGQTILASGLTNGLEETMVNDENITINNSGGSISVSGAYFQNSPVSTTDLTADNGVIHKVTTLFTPPSVALNVPSVIATKPSLATFSSLLTQTGLDTTLQTGEWTVLAPTNDAFNALPSDTLAFITAQANADVLKAILNYHLISGVSATNSLVSGNLATAEGSSVAVSVSGSTITFNTATVVALNNAKFVSPNILGNNGVAYAIDAVLIPPDVTIPTPAPRNPTSPPKPTAAPVATTPPSKGPYTLVDVAIGQPDLSSLVQALESAMLGEFLNSPSNFTVFAPINTAIQAVQNQLLKLTTPEYFLHLQDLLYMHVVEDYVLLKDNLVDGLVNTTVNGENITFSATSSGTVEVSGQYFNRSNITEFDLTADNGVLHKVDKVFFPASVALDLVEYLGTQQDVTTFQTLISQAGLDDTLTSSDYSVLAPIDAAFDDVPPEYISFLMSPENIDALTSVLTYHLIPMVLPTTILQSGNLTTFEGSSIVVTITPESNSTTNKTMFNQATVLSPNGLANNGIVYTIDSVLIPPGLMLPPTASPGSLSPLPAPTPTLPTPPTPTTPTTPTAPTTPGTVAEVIANDTDLSVLETALVAANLNSILSGTGPYTVFGPVNSAFATLDQSYFDMLLEPQWILHLQNFLMYHVAQVLLLSTDLVTGLNITMMNNENVTFNDMPGQITVSGQYFGPVPISGADMNATNGVVHKVDAIFLPEFLVFNLFQRINSTESLSILAGLLVQAGLDQNLTSGIFTVLAPPNSAFMALPSETLSLLTNASNVDYLRNVLEYHLLPNVYPSDQLTNGEIVTAQGSNVTVTVDSSGNITFNDAKVLASDGLAQNGLANAIDRVLFPPTSTPAPASVPVPSPRPSSTSPGLIPTKAPSVDTTPTGQPVTAQPGTIRPTPPPVTPTTAKPSSTISPMKAVTASPTVSGSGCPSGKGSGGMMGGEKKGMMMCGKKGMKMMKKKKMMGKGGPKDEGEDHEEAHDDYTTASSPASAATFSPTTSSYKTNYTSR